MIFKRKFCLLFLVLCICINPEWVYSKVYRISPKGGSFDNQFERIVNEIKKIPGNEDIIVKIAKGYYSVSNTLDMNCENHRVSIIGSRKKATVISGSIKIDCWEPLSSGLWRSRVPSILDTDYVPDQLFVNGVRATRSRTPNEGAFLVEDGFKAGHLFGAKLTKEDIDKISFFSDDEAPFLTIFRKWTASKRYLSYLSREDTTLFFSGIEFPAYIKLEKGNGVIVENTMGCIDVPGEWCVDKKGYIYYLPKAGEVIEDTEFRIPVVEKLLSIQSASHLIIKNIIFEHTSYQLPDEGVEFVQAASSMGAAIQVDNVYNFHFENCEIRNICNYGIWLRNHCVESYISNSYFHDLGAGAIKIGTIPKVDPQDLTNHIFVVNNIIYKYGVLMEGAVGILVLRASDCKINHNDIHYGNYSGISLGWVWGFGESPTKNNEVSFNRLSHLGSGLLNDLGGIYTIGRSEGTYIHNNVISDIVSGDFRGWGIYADEGTSGVLFEKNLAYNCTSGGFHQHYGSENVVINNIFAWGEKSQITYSSTKGDNPLTFKHNIIIMKEGALFTGAAISSTKFVVGNNCYWSVSDKLPHVGKDNVLTWIKQRDTSSVYENPCFRDPQNADFRFLNKDICSVIGFEEIDFTKAGVYGKRKWRRKATRELELVM